MYCVSGCSLLHHQVQNFVIANCDNIMLSNFGSNKHFRFQSDSDVPHGDCLLQLMVMTRLDAVSLVRLSAVCKELLVASRDRFLWRMLYLTDFGRMYKNPFRITQKYTEDKRCVL